MFQLPLKKGHSKDKSQNNGCLHNTANDYNAVGYNFTGLTASIKYLSNK